MRRDSMFGLAPGTVSQIQTEDGAIYPAYATEKIWSLDEINGFSKPTLGNDVRYFPTGAEYFKDLRKEIKSATRQIWIAGWQINWDALLEPGVRLYDVLLEAASKEGVSIYVLPWNDEAPIQTYDSQTREVLLSINKAPGVKNNPVHVTLAAASADKNSMFFSHHQKLVVIDEKIAYVGGLDLAYGRYDDARFDLALDSGTPSDPKSLRHALNRYNPCIPPLKALDPSSVVDPDHLSGRVDAITGRAETARTGIANRLHQAPYETDGQLKPWLNPECKTLDETRQPRMPWHDAHCRIEGPAVSDLARNFVGRWNAAGGSPRLALPAPSPASKGPGGCTVQVLRSAPANLCLAELRTDTTGKGNGLGPQAEVHDTMQRLISVAQHFIYIENQFFVSNFGAEVSPTDFIGPADEIRGQAGPGPTITRLMPGDSTAPPENSICHMLGARIGRAILAPERPPFHVYIVLPVHPEGPLNDPAVVTQVHWTMQSLVFGRSSLLNRIRRFLLARELYDKKDNEWRRALDPDNVEYEGIELERCDEYITLLNLRNWAQLKHPSGPRLVTEQIYVHSKLMVVDDRFALLGSANINDRSLLGSRDSELAVLIKDTAIEHVDLCGDDRDLPVRTFARDLRRQAWRKIFGLTAKVRPANALEQKIDKPGDPKTWRAIQKVARDNTDAYERAFSFIPRSRPAFLKPGEMPKDASIWPIWKRSSNSGAPSAMPFSEGFWDRPQHSTAIDALNAVQGFITALPIHWTRGENNKLPYHSWLVATNTRQNASLPQQAEADTLTQAVARG